MTFRKDSIGFQGTPVDSRGFQGIFVDSEDSSLLGFRFQTIIIDAFSLPILFVTVVTCTSRKFSGILGYSCEFLGISGDSKAV